MIAGTQHLFICVPCEIFTYLKTPEHLSATVREHKRKHLSEIRGYVETVTVLYDGRDETDPWLSALMKWRTEHRDSDKQPDG